MFSAINTLFKRSQARANDRMRDHFAIDLIEQKIREADGALKAAKATLASLIMRHRNESKHIAALDKRIVDPTSRTNAALEDMASEAAIAIAQMENESTLRSETAHRLEPKITTCATR